MRITRPPRRRKFLLKVMLYLIFASSLALVALWFYITQPLFWGGQARQMPAADPARLAAHVEMIAGHLSPRDHSHPANLDRVADYLRAEFTRAGGRVSDQPFEVNGLTYRNVIATFGPEAGERVVIGAHYDAAGPLPGADDNASGVAGLLELARLLNGSELPLKVELVAYTLEEPPYFRTTKMGSAIHAAALKKEGAAVRAMLSLEMIGFFSDAAGSQAVPVPALSPLYPNQGNFITVVGRFGQATLVRRVKQAMVTATPLPVRSITAPASIPGVDFSDHLNYWQQGYGAVMITDTAFYRNPHYHTAEDTPGRLDYQRMAQVVDGVRSATLALSR